MATSLAELLEHQWTGMDIEIWMEPFAGGAGAGLAMLERHAVSEIWLVEKHPALAAFWQVAVNEGEAFAELVAAERPDLARFEAAKDSVERAFRGDRLDPMMLALDAFIVNRCSRSGIVAPAAGPIGGKRQDGAYTLSDRWNGAALAERIRLVGRHGKRGNITVIEGDGIEAIEELPNSGIADEVFLFVDPPYIREGNRLYQQGMDDDAHRKLAAALCQCSSPWILTYDDAPSVANTLYPEHRIIGYQIPNSTNRYRVAEEYAVLGHGLMLPSTQPLPLLPGDAPRWIRESVGENSQIGESVA